MPRASTILKFLLAVGGLVAVAAAGWWYSQGGTTTATKYRTAKIERGPIVAAVAASGTLNAVVTVQVGSQISGQIRELLADFNTPVRRDQVIARIDPATLELRVAQSRADVDAANSAVSVARANLLAQQAQLAQARANLVETQRDLERKELLITRGFLSPAERDKARTTLDAAREQINALEAQSTVAAAQVVSALASVKQRESALRQAEVDLDRTYIRAPVDGVVVSRNVDAGQTVAASLQAPTLFTIAQDLRQMQVEASIDEADVGRLALGQAATFTVDAFPRRSFAGAVRQIRKAAQNVQNVVTYTVVISASNPDLQLLPGMTANVRIVTDQRESVLKVSNAALRFRPANAEAKSDARPAVTPAAAPGQGGGPAQAQQFRERVLGELNLDEGQKARVEQLFAESRQKMAALREVPDEAERRKGFERQRAELRARIADTLRPEQKPIFERIAAEQSGRATDGRVYVTDAEGKAKPVDVKLGLSDGTAAELIDSPLKEGDEVIVGVAEVPKKAASGGPRMF